MSPTTHFYREKQWEHLFFSASEEVVVGGGNDVPVAASEEVVITNNVDLPIEGTIFDQTVVWLWFQMQILSTTFATLCRCWSIQPNIKYKQILH